MDCWELLRAGRNRESAEEARRLYLSDPTSGGLAIQAGAILLWLGEWESACNHFHQFISAYQWTTDFAYRFAGTAKWCGGDESGAIGEWLNGVNVEYADTAGGITIPLHLVFSSAKSPEKFSVSDAVKLLKTRAYTRKAKGYPGVLGRLVLGDVGLEEAIACANKENPNAQHLNPWKAIFWDGVRQLLAGDVIAFHHAMRRTSQISWYDFDEDRDLFIAKVRSTEFHLARHEIERSGGIE